MPASDLPSIITGMEVGTLSMFWLRRTMRKGRNR